MGRFPVEHSERIPKFFDFVLRGVFFALDLLEGLKDFVDVIEGFSPDGFEEVLKRPPFRGRFFPGRQLVLPDSLYFPLQTSASPAGNAME